MSFTPASPQHFRAEPFSSTALKTAQRIDIQSNKGDRKSPGDFLSEERQGAEKPGRPHPAPIRLRIGSLFCGLEIAKQSQKEKKAGHGHFPAGRPRHDLHLQRMESKEERSKTSCHPDWELPGNR